MRKVRNVVWVASYPKSGNTWVHQVLKAAAINYDFPKNANLDVYHHIKSGAELNAFPNISQCVTELPCALLKTHDVFPINLDVHWELNLNSRACVYVRRNPLDTLLSYLNFSRIQYANSYSNIQYQNNLFKKLLGFKDVIPYEKWRNVTLDDIPQKNLDHALDFFNEEGTSIPNLSFCGSWLEHNLSWRNSNIDDSVVLMYERCLDGEEEFYKLKKLFCFSDDELRVALNKRNKISKDAGSGKVKGVDSRFYNKMTSFYYLDYFSKDKIKRFLSQYDSVLTSLGYANLPY